MNYQEIAIEIIKNYLHLPKSVIGNKTEAEYILENFGPAISYMSNLLKENENQYTSNVTSKKVGNITYNYETSNVYIDSFVKNILPKPYMRAH